MKTKRSIHTARIHFAVAVFSALLAGPAFASDARQIGRCVSVEVPSAIVLPDGSRHDDVRQLKLCVRERISPTACLHEFRLDGHPVGLFRSESGRSEDRAELTGAVVVFEKNLTRSEGDVVVWGYAVQEGERLRVFRMDRTPRGPGM